MTNRPEMHTADHDQWDQGGYCNSLVIDHDGETATVCGYRQPRVPVAPTVGYARDAFSEEARDRYGSRADAGEAFDALLVKVRADAVRSVTGALEDEQRMRRMDTDHVRDLEAKIAAADAGFQQLHWGCDNEDHRRAYDDLAKALGYQDLEPDRDPETGSMIPCVVCTMSGQVGGTGVCSRACSEALREMYPEDGPEFQPGECQGHDECPAPQHVEGCFATAPRGGVR